MRVFGHRGACAYRPENTLEAIELAFQQGVEAIECDVVPTKDGRLVLRHEADLRDTTDILSRQKFAGRFHSNELILAEIKELRAKERVPDWRPGSAKFDGQFEIPTLEELLESDFVKDKLLILEVKDAPIFAKLGIDIVELFARALENTRVSSSIYIEAFEWETVAALKARLGDGYTYIYGMEEWDEVHAYDFDAVSLDFQLIRKMPQIVAKVHDAGLPAYGFTARVEFAKTSVEEYFHKLFETGVDGIFADHPDLLLTYVDGLA